MYKYSSRITRLINPITGEVNIYSRELKENRTFKSMYGRNIDTGEVTIDRRNEVYWKNENMN